VLLEFDLVGRIVGDVYLDLQLHCFSIVLR
jgi:hypothetical protein